MPKDIKRVNFEQRENIPSPYKKPATECVGCKSPEDKLKKLQETVENFRNEIMATVTAQNVSVMSALLGQSVLTQKLVTKDSMLEPLKSCFPLRSAEDLTKIDEKVMPETHTMMISTIRCLLQHSVAKNLVNVFTTEFIMEYNIDGTHGKKGIKEFKNFYAVLLESIISFVSNDDPETQLRKALQLHKKRFFQKKKAKEVKSSQSN